MSTVKCPSCGAGLYACDLAENTCTACMRPLPAGFQARRPVEHITDLSSRQDWGGRGDPDRDLGGPFSTSALRSAEGWGLLRLGLRFLFWGLVLILGSLALQVAEQVVFGKDGRSAPPALEVIPAALAIGAGLLLLVGYILCCTIPRRSGARGWAIGALVALGVYAAGYVALHVVARAQVAQVLLGTQLPDIDLRLVRALALLGVASAFLSGLCMTLVLRAAANFWGDRSLGNSFLAYFIVCWTAPWVWLSLTLWAGLGAVVGQGSVAVAVAFLGMFFVGLLLLVGLAVWGLVLVVLLRKRIPAAPGRPAYNGYQAV
jgi:hypothetical protein